MIITEAHPRLSMFLLYDKEDDNDFPFDENPTYDDADKTISHEELPFDELCSNNNNGPKYTSFVSSCHIRQKDKKNASFDTEDDDEDNDDATQISMSSDTSNTTCTYYYCVTFTGGSGSRRFCSRRAPCVLHIGFSSPQPSATTILVTLLGVPRRSCMFSHGG
jgi:hypothetical protein